MSARSWMVPRMIGLLVVGAVTASCAVHAQRAAPRTPTPDEGKITVQYDASQKKDQKARIMVRKKDGLAAEEFGVCADPSCGVVGLPVTRDGKPVLGPLTVLDVVYFVSDVASPGQTCVCYGNTCYCN